jgi:hypothetical protein
LFLALILLLAGFPGDDKHIHIKSITQQLQHLRYPLGGEGKKGNQDNRGYVRVGREDDSSEGRRKGGEP